MKTEGCFYSLQCEWLLSVDTECAVGGTKAEDILMPVGIERQGVIIRTLVLDVFLKEVFEFLLVFVCSGQQSGVAVQLGQQLVDIVAAEPRERTVYEPIFDVVDSGLNTPREYKG